MFTFVSVHKSNGCDFMFYNNFVDLCNKVGKSPSAAAEEMGYQRSVVTRWSKGTSPRQATLQRIAEYFGVSVSELTADEKENPPDDDERFLPLAERREALSRAGIHIMLDADAKVTEEQLDDIISFIEIQQRRNGR